jgi:hypothetical protein
MVWDMLCFAVLSVLYYEMETCDVVASVRMRCDVMRIMFAICSCYEILVECSTSLWRECFANFLAGQIAVSTWMRVVNHFHAVI